MTAEEWTATEHVDRYLARLDDFPHRLEGEAVLLEQPARPAAALPGRLHLAFFEAIGEPIENEDPSDRLLDVETQLAWLREIGFDDVDCYWKWLEMALMVGVKPS